MIQAGNGTHTGRMLGYCPACGLYHEGPEARRACVLLTAASAAEAEAWKVLKAAVDNE
jgi:hypothetical protein